jgi:hypothetical protein
MPNIGAVLKQEIARLSRREIRGQVLATKKAPCRKRQRQPGLSSSDTEITFRREGPPLPTCTTRSFRRRVRAADWRQRAVGLQLGTGPCESAAGTDSGDRRTATNRQARGAFASCTNGPEIPKTQGTQALIEARGSVSRIGSGRQSTFILRRIPKARSPCARSPASPERGFCNDSPWSSTSPVPPFIRRRDSATCGSDLRIAPT